LVSASLEDLRLCSAEHGVRLLEPKTVEAATRVQSAGEDLVLGYETRYATGFQLSFPFRPMAGEWPTGFFGDLEKFRAPENSALIQ